ncbi:CinA family protein [Pararhizobium gei]|uniref:CinA family protein n=1 Tax=Pararhizobium gei TaxID=1395951 RepID=UPI0023DA38C5|nr:CinA family protein [Rhizobium gei]
MSGWPDNIEHEARRLIAFLAKRSLMVVTAESCTGGLIAGALTEVPGSSAVVDRGFVTYSNDAKMQMLGVDPATLAVHGAVSRQTAIEMARGAILQSKAQLAIAVTGIAGPGGGSEEKPVGLVHLATAGRAGLLQHREMRYGNIGRDAVRLSTVRTALEMLGEAAGEDL